MAAVAGIRCEPESDKDRHILALDDRDPSPDSGMLLATADYYRLSRKAVTGVVEDVRTALRGWEKRARAFGAPLGEVALMQAVIDPDR